jgi:hypothetical protein
VAYNIWLTEVLGLGFGYVNTLYDYDQKGPGSRSALLDRMEHIMRADAKWQVNPSLVALLGYQFGINDYTGDELLFAGSGPGGLKSDERDTYSHYLYVGADHDFNAQLRGSLRVGVQYTDYHNASESETSPYLDAGLTYTYAPGSSVTAGVKHQRSATGYCRSWIGAGSRRLMPNQRRFTPSWFTGLRPSLSAAYWGNTSTRPSIKARRTMMVRISSWPV